jgi:chromate transporter
LVWALPVVSVMTLLSVLGRSRVLSPWREGLFAYLGPMALGFVLFALYKLMRASAAQPKRLSLLIFVVQFVMLFPSFVLYVAVMVGLGALGLVFDRVPFERPKLKEKPQWVLLGVFGLLLGVLPWLAQSGDVWWVLADRFYRFGASVIGGGQVLVPYMVQTLVNTLGVIDVDTFTIGYGLVQGLPGPMFSFTAFVGGEAAASYSLATQIFTALLSALMIFLPGTLLIFFIAPLWQDVRHFAWIKSALNGVRLGAIAIIFVTWLQLAQNTAWSPVAVVVTVGSALALSSKKIPAPLIVIVTLTLGLWGM